MNSPGLQVLMIVTFCKYLRSEALVNIKSFAFLLLVATLSVLAYLFLSEVPSGFPLDDAWIHQAYARNMARSGQWAFISGESSNGATSTLWVFVLAIGYLFNIDPVAWSILLGIFTLAGMGAIGWILGAHFFPAIPRIGIAFGILPLFEWHLVWAALSGMETLLFTFLVTLLLARLLIVEKKRVSSTQFWLCNTLLVGAASLTRPDGITLLGPAIAMLFVSEMNQGKKWRILLGLALGVLAMLAPLILFNLSNSGSIFPNTFYAKQAEYAILLETPLLSRILSLLKLPLVGIGALLLPGFMFLLFRKITERHWPVAVISLWIIGYLFIFAIRLPLAFQHGRYLMPIMPIYIFLGAYGTISAIHSIQYDYWQKIFSRAAAISTPLILLSFWLLGQRAYANDVRFIQRQMVETALWIDANIDERSLIAAHDIGALGYFTERPIIDLAGLISPDVIAFIRDDKKLSIYLDAQEVDVLVLFPNWYAELANGLKPIYRAQSDMARNEAENSMTVYNWPK